MNRLAWWPRHAKALHRLTCRYCLRAIEQPVPVPGHRRGISWKFDKDEPSIDSAKRGPGLGSESSDTTKKSSAIRRGSPQGDGLSALGAALRDSDALDIELSNNGNISGGDLSALANALKDSHTLDIGLADDINASEPGAVALKALRRRDLLRRHPGSMILVIRGLSTNLNTSDFYRVAGNDLSDWQSAILNIHQIHDFATLEPTGRYHITFASREAATSYRDKVVRLHALSRHAAQSPHGMWENSFPPGSLGSSAHVQPQDLESMTLAPASQTGIDIKRAAKEDRREWTLRVENLIEPLGYGDEPPVVLLHVHPPSLTAQQLHTYIRQDGGVRRSMWDVSQPVSLVSGSQDTAASLATEGMAYDEDELDDPNEEAAQRAHDGEPVEEEKRADAILRGMETLKARFVVACADEAEARRFQRAWNQRVLPVTAGQHHIIQASILK